MTDSQGRKSSRARYKKQRHQLFHLQKGKCHWCKKPMRLLKLPAKAKAHPDDLCTIDHLDDRYSAERGKHGNEYRRVAACRKCNNERARAHEIELGKPVLWAKSGSYPRGLVAQLDRASDSESGGRAFESHRDHQP